MPITRTINYTQNVPVSLGFSNYINTSPSRDVTVLFDFLTTPSDNKMGTIIVPETPNVTVYHGRYTPDDAIFGSVRITGPVADVNTALNGAQFLNNFYTAETLDQDFMSQDRALPVDGRGELCIQINPTVAHGLSVGSFCRISSANINTTLGGQWLVTKIDSTISPTRLWLAYRGGYQTDDYYYNSSYKNITIGAYLQDASSNNIAPIVDVSYNNPHGDFDIIMQVLTQSTGAVEDSGTISFIGSFFIEEPYFTTAPPATFAATTLGSWTNQLFMGEIAQANSNYQSVQLLIKCFENDPMYLDVTDYTLLPGYPSGGTEDAKLAFVGAAIHAKAVLDKPKYITDTSYGIFATVRIGERISAVPTTGVVRWHFYGTPTDCNWGLTRVQYFRPPALSKDIIVETRIVNGRTRVYSTRGKQ